MPFTDPDPELRTVTVPRPPPPPPPVQPPPTAPPAAQPHPTQPTAAAPTQVSDAASGGGYGQPVTKVAPVLISDAASSGGYGTRYYTYRAEAERALKPGQKVGFTTGRGYYLYYPASSFSSPTVPPLGPPTTSPTPTDGATPVSAGNGAVLPTGQLVDLPLGKNGVRSPASAADIIYRRRGYTKQYKWVFLGAQGVEGERGGPSVFIPELAVIRARLIGDVAEKSSGKWGVLVGWSDMDTRGVPKNCEIVVSFGIKIVDTKTQKTRTEHLAAYDIKPQSYGIITNLGASSNTQTERQEPELKKGEIITAVTGSISVLLDGIPFLAAGGPTSELFFASVTLPLP
jgi:hypothetical protein